MGDQVNFVQLEHLLQTGSDREGSFNEYWTSLGTVF